MIFSTIARVAAALFLLIGFSAGRASAWESIKVHPGNPYILKFRGQPTLLRAYAGSYCSVIDTGVPFIPYLDVMKRDGMNITRVWCLGFPPDQPTTAARFLQPWPRTTGQGNALDGLGKWNLAAWDENYFTRLKAFVQAASDRGIVVELTFFSVFYDNSNWTRGPFHPSNNVQGYGPANFYDTVRLGGTATTTTYTPLYTAQQTAVRRIVRELNGFDNVYYEIVNEPFWTQTGSTGVDEVRFHHEMLAAIRNEESSLPNRHMVAHNFAQQSANLSSDFDMINEHYPAAVKSSPTVTFIAGAEALLQNQYSRSRILSLDETDTHIGSATTTQTAVPTRLESWMFLIGGGGIYDALDAWHDVYTTADPSGDNPLGASMRQAVRNIGTYMDRTNLVPLRRNLTWVTGGKPTGSTLQASASPGQQYVAYLHHGTGAAQTYQLCYNPINTSNHTATLVVTLPPGTWRAVWTRPSDLVDLHIQEFTVPVTGGTKTLEPVTYQADVALRIDRTGAEDATPPPRVISLSSLASADGSISLSWTPATAYDVASYKIYRSDSPGVPVDASHLVTVVAAGTTSFIDHPAVRGATYYYTVTAVDQKPNESAPGPETSALSTPPATLSVTAVHGTVSGAGVYNLNSTATLTATADPGYIFNVWSGDAAGTINPLAVTMTNNKAITAIIAPDTSDADHDGLSAYLERTTYGTNPNLADTDGDSLNDLAEITVGTNPLSIDSDGDGSPDNTDAFPLNANETVDADLDGIGNNADPDDDNDTVPDTQDAFPFNPNESADADLDGIGNNADTDDDNDTVPDTQDAFPFNPNESVDTNHNGVGNNQDPDDDGDAVPDTDDAFPLDPNETADTDGDGTGNNADLDDDGDTAPDADDAFPLDPNETADTDGDGTGNNADLDDDDDTAPDADDAFPLDPNETADTDGDGTGNNADPDDDDDTVPDTDDAFTLDPNETADTDGDGTGNNADPDDDDDTVPDTDDAFPLDPGECADTDHNGIGNNQDPDDDGDSVPDTTDAFPLDSAETVDTDNDGTGNNTDLDDDNDGFDDVFELAAGFDPTLAGNTPESVASISTPAEIQANSAVGFQFNAANGVSYRIESSTDLIEWNLVETDIVGQSAAVTRSFSIENQPIRYFRVRRNEPAESP